MSGAEGYRVNMRVDTRTGERLAVIADAYGGRQGSYYLAITESDACWAELSPQYLTRHTRTVADYPQWLKRRLDSNLGYILNLAPRLYGRAA